MVYIWCNIRFSLYLYALNIKPKYMIKEKFTDAYFWPHDKVKIYDHLDDLERLWDNHVRDLELIKKWMMLPMTEALSMLMEAVALMTRMGNRIEYIKTTAVAFFFIGRLNEMQQQCKCLKSFIDETCNSLNYKKEEKEHRHFYSRDIPFKRPKTLFDGIIPDDFDSDRGRYEPMSLDNYSLIIWHITKGINDLYLCLERLTSYVLEEKEGFEMLTTDYRLTAEIEKYELTNLYLKQRQELIDQIPFKIKQKGRDICLKWLKQNELLRLYLEIEPVFNTDLSLIIKRRNTIILKAISAGPTEWVDFLNHLALYKEIVKGLCLNEENGFVIVDDIETSLHPELHKEIYESYIKLHPEESKTYLNNHEHFPPNINKEQGIVLYRFLVKDSFIDATTDESSFLYLMGCTSEQPMKLKKIKWCKNKQLLREMLELLFTVLIKSKSLRKVDLERLTPYCFLDQDGKPLRLAKPKGISSIDNDNLKKNVATILRLL